MGMEESVSVCVVADPGACWKAGTERESFARMLDMLAWAWKSGANAFKPQLLRRGMYRDGTKASELVSQYEMPAEWLAPLKAQCDEVGMEFLCTPYRAEDVPLIDPYVKRWKVAGFDSGNEELLRAMVATGKPIICTLSLGRSVIERPSGAPPGSICLHGVSQYPTPPENMNMTYLRTAIRRTRQPWGLSDHSLGSTAAIIAVAYGATVIEKHLRHWLTPEDNPDYAAAASPEDFMAYVKAIREAELMLGDGVKRVMPGEWTHYAYDKSTGRRGGD